MMKTAMMIWHVQYYTSKHTVRAHLAANLAASQHELDLHYTGPSTGECIACIKDIRRCHHAAAAKATCAH